MDQQTDYSVMSDEELIARLLSADSVPTKTVSLPRLQVPITLRGLTGKEVFELRSRHTQRYKEKGKDIERLDEEGFNAGLIVAATVRPQWGDPQLLSKFKASGPEEAIKRLLLAGELSYLGDVVLDLSGFNLDLDEIKNG